MKRSPFFVCGIVAFLVGISSSYMVFGSHTNQYHDWSQIECDAIFCVDATGKVGLGTTAPVQKLQIVGGNVLFENDRIVRFKDTAGIEQNVFRFNGNNDLILVNSGSAGILFVTDSTKMAITNGGNIGIGTSSPASKLHVQGDLKAEGNTRDDTKCQWVDWQKQGDFDKVATCPNGKYGAGGNCFDGGSCKFYCCDL